MRLSASTASGTVGRWIGFVAMCLGMFMAILDIQVVATSLPTIQSALSIEPDRMSWIQTAYLITEIVAIPLTGLLTRLASMRWLFVGAVTLFTVGSVGCAASANFAELTAWRVLQGFAGGTLIPAVFAAVIVIIPRQSQAIATTLAGVLAVLAPTVGPTVGGWITQTYSWPWLFLINVGPGIVAAALGALFLPRDRPAPSLLRRLDGLALGLMAIALAALELGLKEAPSRGWLSAIVLGLFLTSLVAGTAFLRRTAIAATPLLDLTTLRERDFALACLLSFVLGLGLFGSVYLMPVFLAFVRGHGPLDIGLIMLVTGLTQLVAAPIAVALERRLDGRILVGGGFLVFAAGLGLSAFQTVDTDFAGMILPQMLRGGAVMFCLLPPTRIALGLLPPERVGDASGLFNLMRNLGGAIGIALVDSIIYGRSPGIGASLTERLKAGDVDAASIVGIPLDLFAEQSGKPLDADTQAILGPMIEKAALTLAIDEAWAMLALATAAALLAVFFLRPAPPETVLPLPSREGPQPHSAGAGAGGAAGAGFVHRVVKSRNAT